MPRIRQADSSNVLAGNWAAGAPIAPPSRRKHAPVWLPVALGLALLVGTVGLAVLGSPFGRTAGATTAFVVHAHRSWQSTGVVVGQGTRVTADVTGGRWAHG